MIGYAQPLCYGHRDYCLPLYNSNCHQYSHSKLLLPSGTPCAGSGNKCDLQKIQTDCHLSIRTKYIDGIGRFLDFVLIEQAHLWNWIRFCLWGKRVWRYLLSWDHYKELISVTASGSLLEMVSSVWNIRWWTKYQKLNNTKFNVLLSQSFRIKISWVMEQQMNCLETSVDMTTVNPCVVIMNFTCGTGIYTIPPAHWYFLVSLVYLVTET